MIVDAHTHAFPDECFGREWQEMLGVNAPRRTGQIDELRDLMEQGGIDRAVVLLYARSGELHERLAAAGELDEAEIRERVRAQIFEYNQWGCDLARGDDRFLAFVGINVRYLSADEVVAAIDDYAAAGASGVKIIPPSMRLYGDDPLLWPVYARCAELGLPVLSQSGSGGGEPPYPGADHYGRPRRFDRVLSEFPDLTLILAHMGLGYEEDVVQLAGRHERLFTDTSLRLSRLGREGRPTADELVDLIRRIGVEHVLLGTNYPFVDPVSYRRHLDELPLDDGERAAIAGQNFLRAVPSAAVAS
jgi:predicted TIM-barrel fold metal-dependent hydrolase